MLIWNDIGGEECIEKWYTGVFKKGMALYYFMFFSSDYYLSRLQTSFDNSYYHLLSKMQAVHLKSKGKFYVYIDDQNLSIIIA